MLSIYQPTLTSTHINVSMFHMVRLHNNNIAWIGINRECSLFETDFRLHETSRRINRIRLHMELAMAGHCPLRRHDAKQNYATVLGVTFNFRIYMYIRNH